MNTRVNSSIFNDTGCIRREELLRYRDNKMSGAEKHVVEEHLVDCELCSEALEGLALVKGKAVLDEISGDIKKLIQPSAGNALRPWLAAATIAGVIILSYVTYKQFNNLNEERIAQKEEPKQLLQNAATTSTGISVPSDSIKTITQPAEKVLNQTSVNKDDAKAEANKPIVFKDQIGTFSASQKEVAADVNDAINEESVQMTGSSIAMPSVAQNNVASFSTAAKDEGNQNITYVDNVKIIDYNDYSLLESAPADVPRSTPSKYQNDKKKTEATATEQKQGVSVKRKANYLDMVADPVILFNNGRFESANQGFDVLLKQNKNDQNAAFYKGLSLYNMKQYDPALKLLEPLSNDSTSPFMQEAQFYTAKSYISNGNVTKGKNLLENISNSNGFYSKDAQEDMKNLK